jgi:hypothetical protein
MFGGRAAAGLRRRTVYHFRGGQPGADTGHGLIIVACGGWGGHGMFLRRFREPLERDGEGPSLKTEPLAKGRIPRPDAGDTRWPCFSVTYDRAGPSGGCFAAAVVPVSVLADNLGRCCPRTAAFASMGGGTAGRLTGHACSERAPQPGASVSGWRVCRAAPAATDPRPEG